MVKRRTSNPGVRPHEILIQQLKDAVEAVNTCSAELEKEDIFVHMRSATGVSNRGDRIELYGLILHKSLLDNDSNLKERTDR